MTFALGWYPLSSVQEQVEMTTLEADKEGYFDSNVTETTIIVS